MLVSIVLPVLPVNPWAMYGVHRIIGLATAIGECNRDERTVIRPVKEVSGMGLFEPLLGGEEAGVPALALVRGDQGQIQFSPSGS
jgi:hypothetical protein